MVKHNIGTRLKNNMSTIVEKITHNKYNFQKQITTIKICNITMQNII